MRAPVHTSLPIAVGFGVSNPEHVAQIGEIADGAVIASAMINFLDTAPIDEQQCRSVAGFIDRAAQVRSRTNRLPVYLLNHVAAR